MTCRAAILLTLILLPGCHYPLTDGEREFFKDVKTARRRFHQQIRDVSHGRDRSTVPGVAWDSPEGRALRSGR